MDQSVIEGGVKDGFLILRAAGHADAAQLFLPGLGRRRADPVEVESLLLGLQVLPRIVDAHEGNAHLQHHLLALGEVFVAEPKADVLAGEIAGIGLVQLVAARIGIPGGLGGHRPLLLPIAAAVRRLAHAQDEVHREHRIPVVTERAHQLDSLDFRRGNPADHGARLVGQAFAQVHEDIAGSGREGVPLQRGPGGGGDLRQDAARQPVGIVAGVRLLFGILAAIGVIIHLQRSRGGHRQDGTEFRAADAGQVHMGKAREIAVLFHVRRGPPAAVLVPGVEAGAHHIERRYAHQSVRRHGTGVAGPEIGRADERVHILGLGEERPGQEQGGQGESNTHSGWLFRFCGPGWARG